MEISLFIKGLALGFSIAAPVGPIGILCIRRTLAEGRSSGLFSGLGAATADAIYGFIAAFGLTALSGFLTDQQFWLKLFGGAFLLYLGIRTLISKPADKPANARAGRGLLAAYGSTFILTLTNPMTILSFAAVFAGLGVSVGGGYVGAALMVLGVFTGSALWWLILSGSVGMLRSRVGPATLIWINRFSGAVIILFGLAALFSILK